MQIHAMPRAQGKTFALRMAVLAAHRAGTPIGLSWKGGVLTVPPGYALEAHTEKVIQLRTPGGALVTYRAKPRIIR